MNKIIYRIGIGYDVHRFTDRRKLILGGVHIRSTHGLQGHSDADVLLHAICDALLGAACLGDIGSHFPDTSRKWKGASSLELLCRVSNFLQTAGYDIINVDSTVILERPKVARHIPAMQRKIARTLGVTVRQVSIKATTNEGLSFLGREEGCAAIAVALVQEQ